MSDKERIIKIMGVYTGVILGAGFASGQELMRFFVRFGAWGFVGIVFSGILLSLVGWMVLSICYKHKLSGYEDFIYYIAGKKLGIVLKYLAAIFIFTLFATMLAAGGATMKESFGWSYSTAVLILGGICFVTLLFDLDGLVEINTVLVPILVLGGIFISIYSFYLEITDVFSPVGALIRENWLSSAIIYSSYNIMTGVTVLTSLATMVNKRKTAFWGGVLGGIAMTLLGLCMAMPLLLKYETVKSFEVPFIRILQGHNIILEYMYLFVLFAAIYTTAISNGFAFYETVLAKLPFNKILLKILLIIAAIIASEAGFSNLVGTIYPLFGVIGILQVILIFKSFLKEKDLFMPHKFLKTAKQ